MDRARHLGPKLGPVLLQLPPTLRADPAALDRTCGRSRPGPGSRSSRHDGWWTDEVRDLLAGHGAALCLADSPHPARLAHRRLDLPAPARGRRPPRPCYDRQALAAWAARLAELVGPGADAYVYATTTRAAAPSATPSGSPRRRPGPASTHRVPAIDEAPVG